MKKYVVKKTRNKGEGLFATRNIKRGELILGYSHARLKKWTPKEIKESKIDSDRWDYAGHGKYVLDPSDHACINHSCEPNCIIKHKSMLAHEIYAYRNIKKGEELTHDYAAGAFDIFGKKDPWAIKCLCGSKKCRKVLSRNYFNLPKKLQKEYYKYLPLSIKRKYKKRFDNLFKKP